MAGMRPNRTRVRAVLNAYAPAADGYGGELDLQVLRNDSASADEDFLKPKVGSSIKAFAHEQPVIEPGQTVDIELTVLGGPRGERTVVQAITAVP
ncbi:MAG: hypothetical protein IPP82_09660 [Xanthomonadales bacterium]|nr:hypothetical protein [Xanthomonadales bacterium]